MGDVLVVAEHRDGHFPKTTLVGINAGLEMARKRNGNCIAVVLGDEVETLASALTKYGVSKVIGLEDQRLAATLADASLCDTLLSSPQVLALRGGAAGP